MTSVILRTSLWALVATVAVLFSSNAHAQVCEDFDNPETSVTFDLTPGEREALNLAIPGYIAALEAEVEGAAAGGFGDREFGLALFANLTVPCIRDQINFDTSDPTATIEVTFNAFERVAVQIMMTIWNSRNGVMSHHLVGCRRSSELREDVLCQSFFPLANSVESLFRKISRDQR